ncbi:hypothetical protein K0504_09715 [Neiella marina]|uniref:Uncharacterized protein n=1 Tax=Neiella holothuriorum TaxID=2870530 RepID=A0ABS7EG50_9GAMM|nr:hypothetical protein [Neiella holothuriorum]MBW8191313.1 hypothetical protein [Neiella holothuriorum]
MLRQRYTRNYPSDILSPQLVPTATYYERRFTLADFPVDQLGDIEPCEIEVGFVSITHKRDVAITLTNGNPNIVVSEHSNRSFKIASALSLSQFNTLWPTTFGQNLNLTRYISSGRGLPYSVDRFQDHLSSLIIVRYQFEAEHDARQFVPPKAVLREITSSIDYQLSTLAHIGMPASYTDDVTLRKGRVSSQRVAV